MPTRPGQTALAAFEADYKNKTELNRKILDHLLHDAFSDDAQTEPESDLVLDPEPPVERIAEMLGRYRFRDVPQAYKNLMELATEKIRFLSTRRCRHFLAAIVPQLLEAIAATPDPDSTLVNLSKVSDSLGGKGVLWELFSFNPPTLRLYVELCSSSQYLSGILTSNPGMLDELMDGLVLDRLPDLAFLDATLTELCRGAENLDPILHSFKNAQQLRVGVRDILGKERIEAISGALSDIAQACLERITQEEFARLAAKLGEPMVEVDGELRPCELITLAMGKFGGRELNYYSDLDLVFLYEADGMTVPTAPGQTGRRDDQPAFLQRAGAADHQGGHPARPLRPAVSDRSRACGRPARAARWPFRWPSSAAILPKGRGSFGSGRRCAKPGWCLPRWPPPKRPGGRSTRPPSGRPGNLRTSTRCVEMRHRLEAAAPPGNLKRGPGGLVDIEFLVQVLQLKYAHEHPESARDRHAWRP